MSAPRLAPDLRPARLLFPALCASVLILTACGSDGAPAADPDRTCADRSDLSAARTVELPPVQLRLDSPGGEPRPAAAAAPRTGVPAHVTLSTSSTETSVVGDPAAGAQDRAPTSTAESLTLPLTVRAGCAEPTDLEFTFGTPTSTDAALTPQLAVFDGALGGVRYTADRVPAALLLAPPAGASAPAARAVEQSLLSAFTYAVPVPDAALGPGATWRVNRTVSAASTVDQTMTVTLTGRDGDRLTLDVRIDETPTDPVFRIPGSAQTLTLTRYSNSGSGTLVVDAASLLPVSGSLEMTGARELVGDDPARPILQRTGLVVTWTPSRP